MVQIVGSLNLHDEQYSIYVFEGKELKDTITVDTRSNFPLEIINQYQLHNADKIVLSGNSLLTHHYEKRIKEENSTKYHFNNLVIERL